MAEHDYDVVIYDDVGSPISPKWAAENPVGGSEYGMTQLTAGLSALGYSVLAVSRWPDGWRDELNYDGITVVSLNDCPAVSCKVLISDRFSNPWVCFPAIKAERGFFAAMDIYCDFYKSIDELMQTGETKLTSVFVSEWQKNLFPSYWNKVVIPAMIDDDVYLMTSVPKNPKRFAYASAVCKGLHETLRVWKEVKRRLVGTPHEDIELHVTGPGYDTIDLKLVEEAGAHWTGPLPTKEMQLFIAGSAGLFFVNTFPESFCAVAAVAEAAGVRPHILCLKDQGALTTTIRSNLRVSDEEHFIIDFIDCLNGAHHNANAEPFDFRRTRVVGMWEELLFGSISTQEGIVARRDMRAQKSVERRAHKKDLTIGLIMIAKDEAHVLPRSLGSVKHLIDYYTIILDQDNSDNSEEVIRRALYSMPGQILREPYINVSHARNRTIMHGQLHTDFLLTLDADDVIEGQIDKSDLTADGYSIKIVDGSAPSRGGPQLNELDMGSCTYNRLALIKSNRGRRYEGVDHEFLTSSTPNITYGHLGGAICRRYTDGRSWKTPELDALEHDFETGQMSEEDFKKRHKELCETACQQKFYKRAKLMEAELAKNPTDTRTAFYCAQNYRDAKATHDAIRMYLHRSEMTDGWIQERFVSLMNAADMLATSDPSNIGSLSWEKILLQACELVPTRATEALYHAAFNFFQSGQTFKAYLYAKATAGAPMPSITENPLFLDERAYSYKAAMVYAWAAHKLGKKDEARTVAEFVLPAIPDCDKQAALAFIEACK
jgi:hypothetical protein